MTWPNQLIISVVHNSAVMMMLGAWAAVAVSSSSRADEVYVPPSIIEGVLIVSTCAELSDEQPELLSAEFRAQPKPGRLLVLNSPRSESSPGLAQLQQQKWADAPTRVEISAASDPQLVSQLDQWTRGDCVWLPAADLPADCQPLIGALRQALMRGALVYVDAIGVKEDQAILGQRCLLPDIGLVRCSVGDDADHADTNTQAGPLAMPADALLTVCIPAECWLRFSGRAIMNLSRDKQCDCQIHWPATATYQTPKIQRLPAGALADLVTYRRAGYERLQPEFPAATTYRAELSQGSLVIVGGGRMSPEIWQKFIDLAGGKQSRIVVLPTAMPEPTIEDADEQHILMRMGAGQVRVLPEISREAVSTEEYLDHLRSATGVWFGGGRQWRFVDAYWGTPAWPELKQVLARGGVIGGSSAGATIQGELLVRGHPLGNQIMIADGYRRGLGLLSGVAIDQHFRQRNRFADLAGVVERFPAITGIGIDEGTALVVEAPASCQVLGEGSVWLTTPGQRDYVEHPSGSEFSLQK